MSVVNINTATIEEFLTLDDIGHREATEIINLRDEVGFITLEDLKGEIEEIADIVDSLVKKGQVSFDVSGENLAELRVQIVRSRVAAKEKLDAEVLKVKGDYDERFSELIQTHKKEMDSLKSKPNSLNVGRGDSGHPEEKIIHRLAPGGIYAGDQGGDSYSQNARSRLDRDRYVSLRPGSRESSIGHGQDLEGIGHFGRSRYDRDIRYDRDRHSLEMTGEFPGNSNPGRDSSVNRTKQIKDYGHGPPPPKMATFDGKSEWEPYKVQFDRVARRYGWDDGQKLERLIEALRDKALKFFCTCPVQVQESYKRLVGKIGTRFGRKDLPITIRRKLQDIKQESRSLEEFAELIQELVTEGYPDASEAVTETIACDTFLKGVENKRAALTVMDKDPTTLESALQKIKCAVNNQRLILGTATRKSQPEVRKVHFSDVSENFGDDDPVCASTIKSG